MWICKAFFVILRQFDKKRFRESPRKEDQRFKYFHSEFFSSDHKNNAAYGYVCPSFSKCPIDKNGAFRQNGMRNDLLYSDFV